MKKLNFVIDVGVGKNIEQWLETEGFNVISIRYINRKMPDNEIIKLANEKDAIIVTMDKDFGELVFKDNLNHCGILLLRLDDAVSKEKLAAIQDIIPSNVEELHNNFCVYQNGKLRIKK